MNGSWIGAANEIAARMVESLWRASWQGAIGVAIVWSICRIWRKMPSNVHYALWVLVCLKVLVALSPVGINVPCLSSTPPRQAPIAHEETPQAVVAPTIALLTPAESSIAVQNIPPRESLTRTTWLGGLWLLGVLLVGGYSTGQLAKSRRMIRRSTPCTDRGLLDEAAHLRRIFRLRVEPRLLMTSGPTSAFTFGGIRSTVLISSQVLSDCTEEERRMILAHEFAHIRRRDAWLGLIPQLTQTLFYFHPMVWLACREFEFAREAASDEEAISSLQIGADMYGRLLLKLGSRRQTSATLCTPGVSSHFQLLRRRIAMLDKSKEASLRSTQRRPMVLTCLVGALCIAPLSLVQGQFVAPATLKTTPALTTTSAKKPSKTFVRHSKRPSKHSSTVVSKTGHLDAAKQTPVGPKSSLRIFRLKNADAQRAAEVLRQVLGTGNGGRLAADPTTNSIIVNADDATAFQIASVIKNLDSIDRPERATSVAPKEPRKMTVIPLRYANSEQLFDVLHTLFGNPAFAVVKVVSDERTNSIIVTAPEGQMQDVSAMIAKLDVPTPSAPPEKQKIVRVIKVSQGDPKSIVSKVLQIMGSDAPEFIASDPDNHEIVVRTTQENCNKVQTLVNLLDIRSNLHNNGG